MTVSSTFPHPSRRRGVCLPSCCAGSQRISDSDMSDYEVDDAIGVVPPGAWGGVAGSGASVLAVLRASRLPCAPRRRSTAQRSLNDTIPW